MLLRIRRKIDEIHKKMSTWLCRNHRVVLIPIFETARMSARRKPDGRSRRLNGKTAHAMCTWAYYRFRERLKGKAELFPWCRVIECDEAYTSKTCGRCGQLHHKLGGNKTMRCPHPGCGYVADRDISAARNILLRFGVLFEDPLCYLEPLSGTLTQGIQNPIPSHLWWKCVGFNL